MTPVARTFKRSQAKEYTTRKGRMEKTSVSSSERHREGISSDQISPSMLQKVLADSELKHILADEMKKSGVVTASGYHAVLRKFLLSDRVVEFRGDSDDESEENDIPFSSDQRRDVDIHEPFKRAANAGSSSRQASTNVASRSRSLRVDEEDEKFMNRLSSFPSTAQDSLHNEGKSSFIKRLSSSSSNALESPRNEKNKYSFFKKLSSSGLTESFSNLLIGASLSEELAQPPKDSHGTKKKNLAPRRDSQVMPFDENEDVKSYREKKPALEPIMSGRSLYVDFGSRDRDPN